MDIKWVEGFTVCVRRDRSEVVIAANREGLLSLARQFERLAEEPSGSHIHYDEHNSLEEGSTELIVEKV